MTAIDTAIRQLEIEIDALPGRPRELTYEWFILRAKSTGLSLLRAMRAQGHDQDAGAAERFRKDTRSALVALDPSQDAQSGTQVLHSRAAAT